MIRKTYLLLVVTYLGRSGPETVVVIIALIQDERCQIYFTGRLRCSRLKLLVEDQMQQIWYLEDLVQGLVVSVVAIC